MIVIKNVFGGSKVYIKNVFANAENLVIVYNGGDPIEITGGGSGSGDVVGPASATDNAIARFNLTTGKLIQNSGATIDDSGNITANNLSGTNTGDQDISGKSNVGHTHVKADITDFSDADYAAALGVDDNYVTDAEKTKLANLSGVNTGDQDISGKLDANLAITGATKTKITYDAKGLITSGTDLTLADLPTEEYITAFQALGSTMLYHVLGFTPVMHTTAYGLADNTVRFMPIYISRTTTITGVGFYQRVQGNFTGDNENSISLYSYSGGTLTRVAITANDANIWKGTANTFKTVAFTGTYNAAPGIYFIGTLYNQSAQTTQPSIAAFTAQNFTNYGFTNSAKLMPQAATQNAAAASYAMSSMSDGGQMFIMFLY